MGTRCGMLDPGVVLYMMRAGLTADQIEHELYHRSGLLGVSGASGDMRALLASGTAEAREAVALFVYRIGFEAAALAGALGGIDGFVFTGGIGEHAAAVRALVCDRLRWLGVAPGSDEGSGTRRISDDGSRVAVWVMPTDEEAMIARHVRDVLA